MGIKTSRRKKSPRSPAAKKPAKGKPAQPKAKSVSFRWTVLDANTVAIAGDFNNWDAQVHPLKKGKDGTWNVTLRLKPGSYEYRFIVDGEWREDPFNPNRVANPHGGFNSVCEVA